MAVRRSCKFRNDNQCAGYLVSGAFLPPDSSPLAAFSSEGLAVSSTTSSADGSADGVGILSPDEVGFPSQPRLNVVSRAPHNIVRKNFFIFRFTILNVEKKMAVEQSRELVATGRRTTTTPGRGQRIGFAAFSLHFHHIVVAHSAFRVAGVGVLVDQASVTAGIFTTAAGARVAADRNRSQCGDRHPRRKRLHRVSSL